MDVSKNLLTLENEAGPDYGFSVLVSRRLPPLPLLVLVGCGINVESKQILDSTDIVDQAVCQYGGARVFTGVDDDGNGALSDAEIDGSTNVCFDAPPAVGSVPDVKISATATAGATCSNVTLQVGSDTNNDMAFSAAERTGMATACVPPAASVTGQLATDAMNIATNTMDISTNANGIMMNRTNITELQGRFSPTIQELVVNNPAATGEFASIEEALNTLHGKILLQPVAIVVRGGTYVSNSPLSINHPQGNLIVIEAAEGASVTLQFNGTHGVIFPGGARIGFFGGFIIQYSGDATTGAVGVTVGDGAAIEASFLDIRGFPGAGIRVNGGRLRRTPGYSASLGFPNTVVYCPTASGTSLPIGFHVFGGGTADLPNTTADSCASGYIAEEGGTLMVDDARVITSQRGFIAKDGGTIRGSNPSTSTINGTLAEPGFGSSFTATNRSLIILEGWASHTADTLAARDFEIRDGSVLRVRDDASTTPLTCGRVECDPSAILRGCSDVTTACSAAVE